MAPEELNHKRKPKENQFPFDLGVKGRKTGLVLPELGERDEHGLEPMDHLFSSPEKPAPKMVAGIKNDATLSDEEDMELSESSLPGPVEEIDERPRISARLPPPKSKSPIKTYLQSPARRNGSLRPVSSPVRGSIVESRSFSRPTSVQRKLEFLKQNAESKKYKTVTSKLGSKQIVSSSQPLPPRSAKLKNNHNPRWSSTPEKSSDEDVVDNVSFVNGEDFEHAGTHQDDENEVPDIISDNDPSPQQEYRSKKASLRPKETYLSKPSRAKELRKKTDESTSLATKEVEARAEEVHKPVKSSGRIIEDSGISSHKSSRSKKVTNVDESGKEGDIAHKRSQRSPGSSAPINTKSTKQTSIRPGPRAKKAIQKETQSSPAQPGPPLPKSNGLVILRRETSKDNKGILQTRSGRNSIKPLAFWSNEKIEFEGEELPLKDLTADFAGRKVKQVVRIEETVQPSKKSRTKSQNSKSKKRKRAVDLDTDTDDDDIEAWEANPGRIVAEVRNWDPEEQSGSLVEEKEEEIALSSAAIITRDIANASFRFAKTLTLPFFGAGMVDLPPGSEKKQKNSRKMQMAFFVFYGKVQVTVNDNVFRISKGGMWQVPRGNFYGIQNDYDKPARIFFSQGCEIEEETGET